MSKTLTDSEKLQAARDLITDPEHWTQRADARRADGLQVLFDHPDATKFCARGACRKVKASHLELTLGLYGAIPGYSAVTTNDKLGHQQTLNMFDRTIAFLKSEGR